VLTNVFFYFFFFKSALATANTILGWPIACQGCPVPPRTPLWLRHCLIRKGGDVNGCHILPQPRFNSIDLRMTMNLRDNSSIDGSVTFSYFFLYSYTPQNIYLYKILWYSDVSAFYYYQDNHSVPYGISVKKLHHQFTVLPRPYTSIPQHGAVELLSTIRAAVKPVILTTFNSTVDVSCSILGFL